MSSSGQDCRDLIKNDCILLYRPRMPFGNTRNALDNNHPARPSCAGRNLVAQARVAQLKLSFKVPFLLDAKRSNLIFAIHLRIAL